MAERLWAIANVTGKAATYFSSEYTEDSTGVINNAVTHTGGKDDDYVKIADCSDSNYYQEHHCTVAADDGSFTVTFWNNDATGQDHMFYWSPGNFYTTQNAVAASEDWESVALVIAPGPVVYCTQWT